MGESVEVSYLPAHSLSETQDPQLCNLRPPASRPALPIQLARLGHPALLLESWSWSHVCPPLVFAVYPSVNVGFLVCKAAA